MQDDFEFFRNCTHFIVFYTTRNKYIEILHTFSFTGSPPSDLVYGLIKNVTTDPTFGETNGMEYKKDFSVVELKIDASDINSEEDLTLRIIDKLIDSSDKLGVDLTKSVFDD
jgi:hypothetical protein